MAASLLSPHIVSQQQNAADFGTAPRSNGGPVLDVAAATLVRIKQMRETARVWLDAWATLAQEDPAAHDALVLYADAYTGIGLLTEAEAIEWTFGRWVPSAQRADQLLAEGLS